MQVEDVSGGAAHLALTVPVYLQVVAALHAALSDFFSSKKSKQHRVIVQVVAKAHLVHTMPVYLQVVAALHEALSDFFSSKKSRLPRPAVEAMLKEVPSASPALLPDAVDAAGSARTSFLKVEAFALVAVLLRPPKVQHQKRNQRD